MNQVLKKVKEEFSGFIKENQCKFKHKKLNNMEILSILPLSNTRKKSVKIDFLYFILEEGTDVLITYEAIDESKNEIIESFAFSGLAKDQLLPMIDEANIEKLKSNFNYELVEGKLKNTINLDEQIKVFIEIVKANFKKIINYQKQV